MPMPKPKAKPAPRRPPPEPEDLLPPPIEVLPVPPPPPIGGLPPSDPPPIEQEDAVILAGELHPHPVARDRRAFLPAVGGGQIALQAYTPASGRSYTNWILRWVSPDGVTMERKRLVTAASTRRHGDIEPIAYLHALKALIMAGDPSVVDDRRGKPTQAVVDEQVASHAAAFAELLAASQ